MGLTLRIVHVDSTCSRPTTGSHHHFLLSVAELMLSTILLQMRNRAQEMKESAFAITPPLEGERSIAMSVFACVSVRSRISETMIPTSTFLCMLPAETYSGG